MTENEKLAVQNCGPINFLFTPEGMLSSLMREREKLKDKERKKIKSFSSEFSELLRVISYNTSRLTDILSDLSYIGPIRENPHRVYEVSNESYNTVGHKGENMPNLLKKYKDKFEDELNTWIRKFEFGDTLEFKPLYGNLFSIRFREKDQEKYTSIANAGFGASQLLPLIVQALVAPLDSITIAEQPEIHLNPKLQCVLADLFAYMAKHNRYSIIETHSEHLLLRLRLLIANKTIPASDVAVYFIEKEKGYSKIREVTICDDGHIDQKEWPSDFFADTLRESMALASAQLNLKTN
jgi:predicted ATPase